MEEFQRKFAGDWKNVRRRVDTISIDMPGTVHLLIMDPSVTVIPGGLFAGCKKLRGFVAPYIEDIQNQAFRECDELVKVEAGVLELGADAFGQCPKLRQVKVDDVRLVGPGAFRGCRKLETVEMESVEEIGGAAFRQCELLKEVRVPMLKALRSKCFYDCKALRKVLGGRGKGFPLELAPNACFAGCDALVDLAVKKGFWVADVGGTRKEEHEGIMGYLNWKVVSNEQRHTLLMYLKMTADGAKDGEVVRSTTSHKVLEFLVGATDVTRYLVQFL